MNKQTSLTKTVKNFITVHGMTQTESHILVALSGGADSVCLLCLLKELQEELEITLSALHVHHGIRGEEADRDAEFCQELCAQLKIPCQVMYIDVPAVAKAQKMSLEEAARMVRYQALEEQRQNILGELNRRCDRQGIPDEIKGDAHVRIAVAHHREDQAETVLWNMLRGSGLKGLSGMTPVNGEVIRPLLDVSKEEILEYLRQQDILWQQDSTNESDDYTRNRIRRHVLGYVAEHINDKSAEHICQAATLAGQADAYLQKQARRWLETERQKPDWFVRVSHLVREDDILQSYILRELLSECRGLINVTARHVEAMSHLLADVLGSSAERSVELGEGWRACRSYDRLWVEHLGSESKDSDSSNPTGQEVIEVDLEQLLEETKVRKAGHLSDEVVFKEICWGGKKFQLRVISYEKTQKIPANQYTKWINYDTLGRTLVFRTRQIGDYILLPDGGRKTVKSYMIDEKIPVGERDRIPVIAQGSHVLWIAGYRLSEGAKVGENTHQILEIQMHGG